MRVAQGARILFSVSSKFSMSSVFFRKFSEITSFMIAAGYWLHNRSLGRENNCIAYSLFCIFFINTSISIPFFVVLLNCLYLNPQVLLFSHSPPYPAVGGGVSEQLHGLVASCWVKPQKSCLQLLSSYAFNYFSFIFECLCMNKALRRYVYHGLLQ